MLLKPLPDGRGSSRARMKGGACQNYGDEGRRPSAIRRAATLRSVRREVEAPDAGLARGGCDKDRVATARRRVWRPGPKVCRLPAGGRRIRTRGPALRRPPPRRATGFRAVRPARAAPLGGPKLEIASFSGEAFSCWAYASDHQFVGDAAYINLEIEALYRRTREMPGQTSRDGTNGVLSRSPIGRCERDAG